MLHGIAYSALTDIVTPNVFQERFYQVNSPLEVFEYFTFFLVLGIVRPHILYLIVIIKIKFRITTTTTTNR